MLFAPALDIQIKVLVTTLTLVLLLVIRKLTLKVIGQHFDDSHTLYIWRKNITYFIVTCEILIIAAIWLETGESLMTYLGLLSAGAVVALSDPLSNLVGWLFIMWRRPFKFGDRIQVGGYAGDVVDIRLFEFTLLEIGNWVVADQSTGRVIHIPNSRVFKDSLCNYTSEFPFIWHEIPVTFTFESNWRKAKAMIQDIADAEVGDISATASQELEKVNKRFVIGYTVLTPMVYTSVVDYGVRLTLRYLCPPRRRRGTTHRIWEAILQTLSDCDDIAFAYPTQRFFNQVVEGKPGPYPSAPSGEVILQ